MLYRRKRRPSNRRHASRCTPSMPPTNLLRASPETPLQLLTQPSKARIMEKPEKRKKSEIIMVRVAPDDHEALRQRAQDASMTVPAYLLASALGRKARSHADTHIIEELRRLASLQREMALAAANATSAQYSAVLLEIIGAMRRLGG